MTEPVAARLGARAGEDFDRIAALELSVKWSDSAVDLGSLAFQADFGMHMEGKVDGGGALGQPLHVSLRGEDEDLVLIQVDLEELEELFRTVGVLLQFQQLSEPAEMLVQLVRTAVPLVQPVRCNAVFGCPMHVESADLHLEQLSAGAKDGRMKRLIRIRLGAGDVVLDPLLNGRPVVMDDAQDVVAIRD